MQQKVQFIITILHEPKLLIFDEPFSGFDPINTSLLKKEIIKLQNKGTTIIFSTHDMGSVEELCDHITLINNSRTILEGSVDEIRNYYASNRFEIRFDGEINLLTASLSHSYKIIDNKKVNGQNQITVDLMDNTTTNDVLSILLQAGKVVAFNKVIPGMNEIFIKAVNDAKKE